MQYVLLPNLVALYKNEKQTFPNHIYIYIYNEIDIELERVKERTSN